MSAELKHPELYARQKGPHGEQAVFLVIRCSNCNHVSLPRQSYGCEKCGALGDDLVETRIPAAGVLQSYATVHLHRAEGIEAPFVIGEIKLDDGPTVRTTMRESTDEGLLTGTRVVGVFHDVPDSDADASRQDAPAQQELRFAQKA